MRDFTQMHEEALCKLASAANAGILQEQECSCWSHFGTEGRNRFPLKILLSYIINDPMN